MKPIYYVLISMIFLCGCRKSQEDNTSEDMSLHGDTILFGKSSTILSKMKTLKVTSEPYKMEFTTSGVVKAIPTNYAEVASPFAGRITKSFVRLGQKVSKGSPIFAISSPAFYETGKECSQAREEMELAKRLFGAIVKPDVIHQVVMAQEANSRQVLAHTKTRAEVRGGGKKPWKQKGTGRARHGSTRSPIWVGGGVTFGPRSDRNFTLKVNKKQKQAALAMCLTDKVENKSFVILDKLANDSGKTKEFNVWLTALKGKVNDLSGKKKVLIVMGAKDAKLTNSAMNLTGVTTIAAGSLNCKDILKANAIIADEKAIAAIDKQFKKVNEKKDKVAIYAKSAKKAK